MTNEYMMDLLMRNQTNKGGPNFEKSPIERISKVTALDPSNQVLMWDDSPAHSSYSNDTARLSFSREDKRT